MAITGYGTSAPRIGKTAPGTKKPRASGLLASAAPKKHWLAKATANKGGLHRSLGIPEGEKIPAAKEAAAAKRPGKVGAEARLAEQMKGFKR
jgi:hypothetical protein